MGASDTPLHGEVLPWPTLSHSQSGGECPSGARGAGAPLRCWEGQRPAGTRERTAWAPGLSHMFLRWESALPVPSSGPQPWPLKGWEECQPTWENRQEQRHE